MNGRSLQRIGGGHLFLAAVKELENTHSRQEFAAWLPLPQPAQLCVSQQPWAGHGGLVFFCFLVFFAIQR